MGTDLTRIGEKARKEPGLVFTSLYHHIFDGDNLRACYDTLGANKATGVDGVTKEEYGENLGENLRDLSARLKRMGYRPGPKRRSYIPKAGSEKGRPLGISNLEDKIVEEATKRTLEPIYEAVFEDSSYGYRPGRSQHQCLDALGRTIQQKKVNYVVEADIKGFLETSSYCTPSHERLSKRVVWVPNTLIYKPFRFPQRTWTAGSSPRFTRCNTVWRETPRSLVASSIGTWPSGTSCNEACTNLLIDADAPWRTRGDLFAGNETIGKPTMHGGRDHAEDFCGPLDRHQLAFGGNRGRVESRDLPIPA